MASVGRTINELIASQDQDKPQPVLDMRKKQGAGFWMADIGEDETEEEKKKRLQKK